MICSRFSLVDATSSMNKGCSLHPHRKRNETVNTKFRKAKLPNMDLDTAASYAEILGLVTILGAAIYSWFQIKELRRSRDSTTAMSLAANFQDEDFVVGLTAIMNKLHNARIFESNELEISSDFEEAPFELLAQAHTKE